MRRLELRTVLWVVFGLLILTGGYVMLRACDFGFVPLFGPTSCASENHAAELAAEEEKEAQLRAGIHTEQVRIALLPVCPQPLPPKPKDEPPKPKEDIVKKFQVPTEVKELKG